MTCLRPVLADCVEKRRRLRRRGRSDSVLLMRRTDAYDGTPASRAGALFYEFSVERHIPPDHLLRSIDRFIELDDLRRE